MFSSTRSPEELIKKSRQTQNSFIRFVKLCRVMTKSDDSKSFMTGGSKKFFGLTPEHPVYKVGKGILIALIYLLVFAYSAMFGVGLGVSGQVAYPDIIFLLTLALAGLVLAVGVYYAAVTLFYSQDIPTYLALPIKQRTFVFAKFSVYFASMAGLCVLAVPALITAGVFSGVSWAEILLASFGTLLTVIPPTCVVILLTSLLLVYTPLGKNRDTFLRVYGIVMMILFVGIAAYFYTSDFYTSLVLGDGPSSMRGAHEIGSLIMQFIESNPILFGFVALVSPYSFILPKIAAGGADAPLFIALMFGVLVVYVGVIAVFAQLTYLKAALKIQSCAGAGGKALKIKDISKHTTQTGTFKALMTLDVKRVVRSPMMLQQYLIGPAFSPLMIAIFIFFVVQGLARSAGDMPAELAPFLAEVGGHITFFNIGRLLAYEPIQGFALVLGLPILIGCGLFNGSMAAYGMSAISLEGTDFFHLRTFPVNYRTYLKAKLCTAVLLSEVIAGVLYLVLFAVTAVPLHLVAIYTVALLFGTTVSIMISIAADAISPKLDWDNEMQLKNRVLRIYFLMLVYSIFAALMIVPPLIIVFLLGAHGFFAGLWTAFVCLLLFVVAVVMLGIVAPKRLERIEP